MKSRTIQKLLLGTTLLALLTLVPSSHAQRGRGPQGPQVVSPEVSTNRQVTFRILAPKAETVRLNAGDIPGNGQGTALTKATNGVWEVTLGPIDPGTYRYHFNVDGAR